jgi:hypothetical protein
MNERQNKLYEYLLEKGDCWTTQAEVARELYNFYGNGECLIEAEAYHNSMERKVLSKDIAEINLDPKYEKIIISSGKGIKIANEEEHNRYICNHYKAIFRKLNRVRAMERKGNLHNQIDFDGKIVDAFIEKIFKTY